MEVPERLALIGGSILLSSTLIFTLKSQASSILPNVGHAVSNVFDHIGDAQKSSNFDDDFKNAQKQGWQTGQWGSSKYYIDDHMNMHIGSGQLQGKMVDSLGENVVDKLNTINIDQSVQAPLDSSYLLAPVTDRLQNINENITAINGLDNLDTSQAQNMTGMFTNYAKVQDLNLSSFDTSNVRSMLWMFNSDKSLRNINMSGWDTSNNRDTEYMFYNVPATKLDLSSFDTSNVQHMDHMYANANNLNQLILGNRTVKKDVSDSGLIPSASWQNGNQVLASNQLQHDNSLHPGTWVKQ